MNEVFEKLWKMRGGEGTFEEFMANYVEPSEEEKVRRSVADQNSRPGTLGADTGYDCPKCMNRGYFMAAEQYHDTWIEVQKFCDCWKVRDSIKRMKRSGLEGGLRKMKDFNATEEWQQNMVNIAMAYVNADHSNGESLALCGAVGSGKTFIGSAVCRELLHKGHEVVYMPWVNEAQRLKAMANDERLPDELGQYTKAEYLYIDDLFKPLPGQTAPTPADFRLAYDIINWRYINKLPMIISCEKFFGELLELDEATISRLYEMAKSHMVNIERKPGRNYRLKDMAMI